MALDNLIAIQFTEKELQDFDKALVAIEAILKGKTVNLTPTQRRQYGSIAEQNKLFVNKAKESMEQNPQYVPNFLNKAEFDKDYAARMQLETRFTRLGSLMEQLSDTKIVLDHDNYHNAITYYRNIRFLASQNVPGINTIFDTMKQFFDVPTTKPEE